MSARAVRQAAIAACVLGLATQVAGAATAKPNAKPPLDSGGLAGPHTSDAERDRFIQEGDRALQLGRWSDAEKAYREADRVRPNDPTVLGKLGATLQRLERPAEAASMFARALQLKPGYLEFELGHAHGSSIAMQFAQLFQEECTKAGIRVHVRPTEASTYFERIEKSDFDAAFLGWRLDLDPDVFDTFHSSMTPPNGLNSVQYSNARVDSLLVAGRREFDQGKRERIYHQVHRLIAQDQPYTFINTVPDKRPIAKRIHGISFAWSGPYDFWPGANYWWVDDGSPETASQP